MSEIVGGLDLGSDDEGQIVLEVLKKKEVKGILVPAFTGGK